MGTTRPPRPSRYELPSPVEVLYNFSNFLDEAPPIPLGDHRGRAGYRVTGPALSEAHCVIEWDLGEEVSFIIGHYQPAKGEWQIFPESVPNERQAAALAIDMQHKLRGVYRQAVAEGRRPGGGFVDVHTPVTRDARLRLEQLLAPLRPLEFAESEPVRQALSHGDALHEAPATLVVGSDASTFCFPTLGVHMARYKRVEPVGVNDTITTSETKFTPDALLTLCYTGLIVQAPNQRGKMRALRHVPVAHGDPDLGWRVNADLVSPEQWDILKPVAGALTEMSHHIPRFSPLYSSVVYGKPDENNLQIYPRLPHL